MSLRKCVTTCVVLATYHRRFKPPTTVVIVYGLHIVLVVQSRKVENMTGILERNMWNKRAKRCT
jgi:hypothetical protein